jgi:hypothetical protein
MNSYGTIDKVYKPFPPNTIPRSLAADTCKTQDIDYGTRIVEYGKGPSHNNNKVTVLNKTAGLTYDQNFYKTKETEQVLHDGKVVNLDVPGYGTPVYTADCDARIYNAMSGQLLKFSEPPYVARGVELGDLYKENNDYGNNYKSYENIDAGQIVYYVPEQSRSAFQSPNFVINTNTVSSVRKDPMGGLIPEYEQTPVTNGIRNISNYQDTRDTLKHRESILGGLMYGMNKRNYGVMWENTINKK